MVAVIVDVAGLAAMGVAVVVVDVVVAVVVAMVVAVLVAVSGSPARPSWRLSRRRFAICACEKIGMRSSRTNPQPINVSLPEAFPCLR